MKHLPLTIWLVKSNMTDFGTFTFLTRQAGRWHPHQTHAWRSTIKLTKYASGYCPTRLWRRARGGWWSRRAHGGWWSENTEGQRQGPPFFTPTLCGPQGCPRPAVSCFPPLAAPSQSQPPRSAPSLTDLCLREPQESSWASSWQCHLAFFKYHDSSLSHTPCISSSSSRSYWLFLPNIFPECDHVPHHYVHDPGPSHQLSVSTISPCCWLATSWSSLSSTH